MKRIAKSMLGVTLLEIMLVLAVAAMIIVMSVRYYQSANASQQANQVLSLIQVVTASADSLAQASGNYTNASQANLDPLLSNVGGRNLPWGSEMTIPSTTSTSITMSIPSIPVAVCPLIRTRLMAQRQFAMPTPPTPCNASAVTTMSLIYTPNA